MIDVSGKIVVFDSGVGGLNIFSVLRKSYPNENYIYIADEKYMPYGKKNLEFLKKRVFDIVDCCKNAKALIIACNTASAVFSLLGLNMPNVYEIIGVTCKYAVESSVNKRIGVIATDMTISSGRYQDNLRSLGAVPYPLKYSELVDIIESRGEFTEDEYKACLNKSIAEKFKYFSGKDIDTIICGCTHFGYLIDEYKKHIGNINYIVSDEAALEYTERHVHFTCSEHPECAIYTTSDASEFEVKMRHFGHLYNAKYLEI